MFVSVLEGSPTVTLRAWTEARQRPSVSSTTSACACTSACASLGSARMTPPRELRRAAPSRADDRLRREAAEEAAPRAQAPSPPHRPARAPRGRGPAVVAVGVGVTGVATLGSSCDLNALKPVTIGENSFIYAADGTTLGAIPAEQNRQPVPLERDQPMDAEGDDRDRGPPLLPARAASTRPASRAPSGPDVQAGKVVQGGSTITQQLVRNLYPSAVSERFERKIKEACLAIKLDRAKIEGQDSLVVH